MRLLGYHLGILFPEKNEIFLFFRVFSGHIKEVDGKPPKETQWGEKPSFGACLAEFSNGHGGWVHSVSFSANGDKLAWVGHDSSISVVAAGNQAQIFTIKGEFLPLMTCTWITNNSVVGAGKDITTINMWVIITICKQQ